MFSVCSALQFSYDSSFNQYAFPCAFLFTLIIVSLCFRSYFYEDVLSVIIIISISLSWIHGRLAELKLGRIKSTTCIVNSGVELCPIGICRSAYLQKSAD